MNPEEQNNQRAQSHQNQENWNQFPEPHQDQHNSHQINWQNQHHNQQQQTQHVAQEYHQHPHNNHQEQPSNVHQNPAHHQNNPVNVILQWLTYAFWGWTVLIMSVLTGTVFYSFFDDNSDAGDFTVYLIAAILVLLPLSAITDRFYSKHEPSKKSGAESLVMVVHSVIFAIFGIGALIGSVFALVSLFVNSGEGTWSKVLLASGLVVSIFYAAAFIRTLNPPSLRSITRFFTLFMVIAVGTILLLGIFGPLAKTRATKNDRLIEQNLQTISDSINKYANSNDKLPEKISDVTLKDDAKKLSESNLIEYRANTKQPDNAPSSNYSGFYDSDITKKTFYYELCATFKEAKEDSYSYSSDSSYKDSDGYMSYFYLYEHDAGKQCYKIKYQSY